MAKGRTMQSAERMDRNVIRQSTITAPKTQSRIGFSAVATTSLTAAMTPELPLARTNFAFGDGLAAANSFVAFVTAWRVSALWSVRKIMIGMTLASALSKPVDVSI